MSEGSVFENNYFLPTLSCYAFNYIFISFNPSNISISYLIIHFSSPIIFHHTLTSVPPSKKDGKDQETIQSSMKPITVGNFAFLFNCTPVGRTSDSMMVPT